MSVHTMATVWSDGARQFHIDPGACPEVSESHGRLSRVRLSLTLAARAPAVVGMFPCRSCALAHAVAALVRSGRCAARDTKREFVIFTLERPDVEPDQPDAVEFSNGHMHTIAQAGGLACVRSGGSSICYGFVERPIAEALPRLVRAVRLSASRSAPDLGEILARWVNPQYSALVA